LGFRRVRRVGVEAWWLVAVAKVTGAYIRLVRVPADDHALAEGTFARKQLFCRDPFIAWSHSSRFRTARRLVSAFAGRDLLDYGCGDGTFIACVSDLFPDLVAADLDPVEIARCTERFAALPSVTFKLIRDLEKDRREGRAFDVVTCMEVLEHCTDDSRERVLEDISHLVSRDGVIIISVPVEIGPSLLIKETLRTIAGWRGIGDYRFKERYRLRELLKMTFAGPRTVIARPQFPGSPPYYGHKGFNWRSLQQRLRASFALQTRHFSPLSWSRGWLSSQVWFVCRPR
jgi:SAM-dependent methyltransferase